MRLLHRNKSLLRPLHPASHNRIFIVDSHHHRVGFIVTVRIGAFCFDVVVCVCTIAIIGICMTPSICDTVVALKAVDILFRDGKTQSGSLRSVHPSPSLSDLPKRRVFFVLSDQRHPASQRNGTVCIIVDTNYMDEVVLGFYTCSDGTVGSSHQPIRHYHHQDHHCNLQVTFFVQKS